MHLLNKFTFALKLKNERMEQLFKVIHLELLISNFPQTAQNLPRTKPSDINTHSYIYFQVFFSVKIAVCYFSSKK